MKSFDILFDILKKDRKYSNWSSELTIKDRLDELIGEIKEIDEAIEKDDIKNIEEEFGDVMIDLLGAFAIAEEQGLFTCDSSLKTAAEKMRRRKPHIFEERQISKEEEGRIWHEAKRKEKESH